MRIFDNPPEQQWGEILARPPVDLAALEKSVRRILQKVRQQGDRAVRKFGRDFDGVSIRKLAVSPAEFRKAEPDLAGPLKEAIRLAADNIRRFHERQPGQPDVVETMPGLRCWRKSVPIEKVGLYIPGGSAPLFSTVLMLGIPAVLAGCREIILCSPPDSNGRLHSAILFAARLAGVNRIFKCGGAQAIAAMAYGTESIPGVYKLFGPGNRFVTMAKQIIQQEGLAIDMPAGPSEVAVYADETCHPEFVAADLLSQAEHGPDSQVLLLTTGMNLLGKIRTELEKQIERLPRKEIAMQALAHSRLICVDNRDEAMKLLNSYAPEHLILACDDPAYAAGQVINAGSVFLGHYTPESLGDYASGTNHTLPTYGYARSYSGVSVDSFVRKITFQECQPQALNNIGPAVIEMAEAEGLRGHADAVRIRMGRGEDNGQITG